MWRGELFKRFANKLITRNAQRELSTTTNNEQVVVVERYSKALSWLHWIAGGGALGCVGFVLAAQNTKDQSLKGKYMNIHKSFGLLVAGVMVPRIGLKLISKAPGPLPGTSKLENVGAKFSHGLLYFLLTALPASGIAMGYYGGRGLPFFGYHIEGAAEADRKPAIAKNAYEFHKIAGQALEYVIPVHVGAAGFHAVKGQKIFSRINPFA